jgi:REP element-mobilizing transposase RayT
MDRRHFPKPGTSALRRGRWSEPGRSYLLTFTCRNRLPLFADWTVARVASCALTERRLWRGSKLLSWVLMPDHWHGLVQLSDSETLSTLVSRVKAVSARAIVSVADQDTQVRAAAFHDRALRRDEDRAATARYIILNPVHAGLSARVGDYPFWDADWI